ncbi:Zinc carboxypeptidase [Haladaptatus paucihalophilus DX253]|uniref:Zinc carboxypeptidase n=1 Tax=Haladaptatus paucihalophilus DX253 TaxID=797209 RepID=A0A1M6XHC2_HALPU|nr:Zinc carboxypeptidase [Haladaptatus paucihalophilus DX253]
MPCYQVHDERTHSTELDRSKDIPISRRQFVRLSAATAGAVSLSKGVAAESTSSAPTELYDFVLGRVDEECEIPTLVELRRPAFDALEPYSDDYFRTTTDPTIAAWLRLTPTEARDVAELDAVDTLKFSPGSNPFWRLGEYANGAFPPVDDSVDYIDYEQMVDGIHHLEAEHSDRVRVRSWGQSPGHENLFEETASDPRELWVVEVTNDIDDETAFQEKEKVFFSLSIHGDERSGAEAGSRFVQRLLDGDEPTVEAMLDHVVLLFAYTNPDGFSARRQEYLVNDDPIGDPEPENNSFKRVTGTGVDPNRGYPTVGWVNPAYYPAEPNGRDLQDDMPGVDDDVPTSPKEYEEIVPDSLDIVEALRGYDNLNYGSDLHGMFWSSNFIEGLIVNDQYDHGELHDIYELNRRANVRVRDEIESDLDARREQFEALNREYLIDGYGVPPEYVDRYDTSVPESGYEYGTIFDTIQYTTSGTLISWMSHPEDQGGLGVTMMAHEMGWDNRVFDRMVFRPWLVDLQARGFQEVIRTVTEHAANDVTADIRTGNATTAYVETDSLTRRSSALSFEDIDTTTAREKLGVGKQWTASSVSVPDGTHELSITVDSPTGPILTKLRDGSGRVVRSHDSASDRPRRTAEWSIPTPSSGEWTVEVKTLGGEREGTATVDRTVVSSTADTVMSPDPESVFGYEQRSYSVSPLAYFSDYEAYMTDGRGRKSSETRGHHGQHGNGNITDGMTGLTVEDIKDGALFRGRSSRLAVENLVVSHADGADDDAYVRELDRFVSNGGTLVLTDAGVSHLGLLENDLAAGITADDVTTFESEIPHFDRRNDDHPLLMGTRNVQREFFNVPPLGYPIANAPATGVAPTAFEDAGGTVAGVTDGQERLVTAGSIRREDGSGIHVIGGMLPPAYQRVAHPFGMLEYTATFLSHTMLTNALGFTQRRYVNGDLVETFGTLD